MFRAEGFDRSTRVGEFSESAWTVEPRTPSPTHTAITSTHKRFMTDPRLVSGRFGPVEAGDPVPQASTIGKAEAAGRRDQRFVESSRFRRKGDTTASPREAAKVSRPGQLYASERA